jgi:hypothetical protein
MIVVPRIEGSVRIKTPAPAFMRRFQQRVEAGLLTGQPHPRSNYLIVEADPALVQVRAADWWTAINVGLNELVIHVPRSGEVGYTIEYWRWAAFAVGLSALIGAVLGALFFAFDIDAYVAANQDLMLPGLSVDQNLWVAWGMVLFWGFIWPWLLILLHRRPLHRLIGRIVAEVDGGSVT